ncbi:MAG: class I SAM-dependent methyltransferase [Solirubrobacteraceae bacterium]
MDELASDQPAPRLAHARRRYLPGMGRDWLLPLYDPFTRLVGIESAHRALVEQAELEPVERVLEIGCGTANLALLVKRMRPQIEVVGLDPASTALGRAVKSSQIVNEARTRASSPPAMTRRR